MDDHDLLKCYRDLWKTKPEKQNAARQGIISNDGCIPNCIKLRINAKDKNTSITQDEGHCLRVRKQVYYSSRL